MRDSRFIHQLLVVGALSSVALAASCGGDSSRSSNSNGDNGSGGATTGDGALNSSSGGSSTTAGIGTTSSGGDSANAGATASGGSSSGESSNASGGNTSSGGSSTGGTAGVAGAGGSTQGATGSGNQGGTSGAAGMSAAGGTTGDDGAGGSNGAGGTGGSEPSGVVGTLGEACDSPGALACAGNHQKLTLMCGGDGEWEANQTCGGTEFCDSTEGSTAGVCVEPSVECAGRELDEPFCFEDGLHDCEPDGIRPALVEDCAIECSDRGAEATCINELEPCPDPDLEAFNCDSECGTLYDATSCGAGVGPQWVPGDVGDVMTFRAGDYDDAWECANDETFHGYALHIAPQNGPRLIRGRVAAPWRLWLGFCEDGSAAPEQCFVQEVDDGSSLYVGTDDPNATAATVTLEVVSQGTTCDE